MHTFVHLMLGRFPEHLMAEGKAVTTIRAYHVNIAEFVTFFRDTPPASSRMSRAAGFAVARALSAIISRLGRRVVLQQIRVKKQKISTAIPREALRKCQALARQNIPGILGKSHQSSGH